MAFELITRAEYKAYMGITSTNQDTEIDALIPKVSEFVKTYCRRRFIDWVSEAKTEYFNGGNESFILQETPVLQVLDVEFSADYGQNYTSLTEFTDWVLDDGVIVNIKSGPAWPKQLRGYRVQYFGGFEAVPEDLKLAVLDLVTYYRQNDAAIHSPKAPGTNSVQIEYVSTNKLPAHIRRVLDYYMADYA
jgi:hypothetical protein